MNKYVYMAILCGISIVITFGIRYIPFALFGRGKDVPPKVEYLGEILPPAMMAILVIYCLKSLDLGNLGGFIPEVIGTLAVVFVHLLKRNTLFSIFVGTIVYMLLIRYFAN